MSHVDLYREMILDHSKRPRNFGELAAANARAHGNNPLCGDDIELMLQLSAAPTAADADASAAARVAPDTASVNSDDAPATAPPCAQRIEDIAFSGTGCAICTASASLMTQAIKGQDVEYARALHKAFHGALTSEDAPEVAELGKLESLMGVKEYPIRVKCATLAWHTLIAALDGTAQASSE